MKQKDFFFFLMIFFFNEENEMQSRRCDRQCNIFKIKIIAKHQNEEEENYPQRPDLKKKKNATKHKRENFRIACMAEKSHKLISIDKAKNKNKKTKESRHSCLQPFFLFCSGKEKFRNGRNE
jgi:uncharacterized protein YdaU (DUF1376 family)